MNRRAKGELVFLKLGGSLISDKRKRRSFRTSVVRRVAREIHEVLDEKPGMRLLLAHGGGGFAHFPAAMFRTRDGVAGGGGWRGVAETRRGVAEMNRRVLDCFAKENLFPVLIPPCAGVMAEDGCVRRWDITVIRQLLALGQMPMIHGDVVADARREFTIASTEELFAFLASRLKPNRIILACDVEGVYVSSRDRSSRRDVVPLISRGNIAEVRRVLTNPRLLTSKSVGCDVTGGMAAKVDGLWTLVRRRPGLEARIVSGLQPGIVRAALLGDAVGTAVRRA